MGGEVKLLGLWASPFSLRVRTALDLKGVEYEYIEEDLSNKSHLLLQSNPIHKKIPVLIHDGKPICESLLILEYIDETWNHEPALLPSDPYARALSRFWAAFVDDKLASAFRQTYSTEGKEQEKAIDETLANFGILEEALRTTFKGGPFFGGKSMGCVDIALGALAVWFQVIDRMLGIKLIHPERTPLLHAWNQRFCSVDCVSKSLQDFDKLLPYASNVRARLLRERSR